MSFIVEQKIKGRIYLYNVESYWDKEKKRTRQRRKYIGPKDKVKQTNVKPSLSYLTTKSYGNILLFQHIVESLGLGEVLKTCFDADYQEILALAYYEIMEASPGYLFHYWLEEQGLGQVKSLYSSDIAKLHENIGRNQLMQKYFTQQWIERLRPLHGIYYDITSFPSYSTRNEFVEWGYNRDRETLPQLNLGMVCCKDSGLPVLYKTFPGSIVDVNTITNFLKYLEAYDLKDFILVMDRGFFSTANVLELSESSVNTIFLQPLSFSLKKAKEMVKRNAAELKKTNTAFKYNEEIIHYVEDTISFGEKNFAAHLFFNEKAELEQRHQFLSHLMDIESKSTGKKFASQKDAQTFIDSEIPEKSRPYFRWSNSSETIVKNDAQIKRHMSKLGYFIIISNGKNIDKRLILNYYRDKDKVEKIFDTVKNDMDGNRLRAHSRYNVDGRLFVKFIALIIHAKITKTMRDNKLFSKYSVRELLMELSKLKITYWTDCDPILNEVSKKQKDIFKAFDIDFQKNMVIN